MSILVKTYSNGVPKPSRQERGPQPRVPSGVAKASKQGLQLNDVAAKNKIGQWNFCKTVSSIVFCAAVSTGALLLLRHYVLLPSFVAREIKHYPRITGFVQSIHQVLNGQGILGKVVLASPAVIGLIAIGSYRVCAARIQSASSELVAPVVKVVLDPPPPPEVVSGGPIDSASTGATASPNINANSSLQPKDPEGTIRVGNMVKFGKYLFVDGYVIDTTKGKSLNKIPIPQPAGRLKVTEYGGLLRVGNITVIMDAETAIDMESTENTTNAAC